MLIRLMVIIISHCTPHYIQFLFVNYISVKMGKKKKKSIQIKCKRLENSTTWKWTTMCKYFILLHMVHIHNFICQLKNNSEMVGRFSNRLLFILMMETLFCHPRLKWFSNYVPWNPRVLWRTSDEHHLGTASPP